MSIKSFVTDPLNNKTANIMSQSGELNALVVTNIDSKNYIYGNKYFTTVDGSVDMNVNAGGIPHEFEELIYNENVGTGGLIPEWNMTVVSGPAGNWDFASGTQFYNGTVSISAIGTSDGNVAQAAPSTTNFDLTNYQFLTGYIYITSWPVTGTKEVLLYGWNSNLGTIVGNSVNIGSYVNTAILNTWQKFIIPLLDMNLAGQSINALRIQTVDIGIGTPPDYYLDLITFNGSSSPDSTGIIEFKIEADPSTYLQVCAINMTLAGIYDSTLSNATMPKISHDSFLNLPHLSNGILFRINQDGDEIFRAIFNDIFDMISLTPAQILSYGADENYTWLKNNNTIYNAYNLKTKLWFYIHVYKR